jgi:hypothetical protein
LKPAFNGGPAACISARRRHLTASRRAYRLTRPLPAAGLTPHSPPWPAPAADWLLVPINVTDVFVVVGSHPCWQ